MTAVHPVSRRLRRSALVVGAIAAGLAVAVVVSPSADRVVQAEGAPLGAGGEFHSLTPERIFSSREQPLDVEPFGPKPTNPVSSPQDFHVPLLGQGDVPNEHVLAVAVNVTIAGPTQPGHLRAFPKGGTATRTSIANFDAGQTVANSVILRPGDDGAVTFRLVTGSEGVADVLVDVTGWWSTDAHATRGARVEAITPFRVFNSTTDAGGNLVGPAVARVNIRGAAGIESAVPDDPSVVGVILNLTSQNVFPGSLSTHLSVVPDSFDPNVSEEWPRTSNLNVAVGQTRANSVIVPVGAADGDVHVFLRRGESRVVVDVVGYLQVREDDSRAGRVIPLISPFRAFNTREAAFFDQPLGPKSAEVWSFDAFVNDVKIGDDPAGAQQGLFGNLTAVGLERQYSWAKTESYLTSYPAGAAGENECKPVPTVSNVNFPEAEAVPNLILMGYGGDADNPNRVCVFNNQGYIDYILDVYAIVLADEV